MASPMIAVGQTIGNYTITAKLGEGGMGIVYLAEHPVIGRKVALKAIHPELSRNAEVVSRFITEAKAVNQIGNEHIVDIHDFGNTAEGEFYFIMEFLQGESLADKLKREGVLPAPRALQVAAQVADALAASHAHGIIHRDLKPENIFLIHRGGNSDFVKVLDFGLAKLTLADEKVTHKTRTGSVMGTPYYMSPEQCEGKATIDHRADLYSLGVILFEMMTGRVPFGGDGYGEIIVKHMTVPPPSARALNEQLTAAHEAILMRALAKRREDRFATMEELRAAMLDPQRYLATAPPLPGPATSVETTALPGPRREEGSGGSVLRAVSPEPVAPGRTPTTLGHGAGQLVDDEPIAAPRSRPARVVTVVAALAAGLAGVYFYNSRRTDTPARAHTVEPNPTQPPPLVTPRPTATTTTLLRFTSEPPGATVARRGEGRSLGTTPFEISVPSGTAPIEFIFSMPGHEDTSMSVRPDGPSALLAVRLPEQRTAAPEPAEVQKPVAKSSATKPARPRGAAPKPKRPSRLLEDEDAPLEPSFK